MTPLQLGMIFGSRLALLVGAIAAFAIGVAVAGGIGNVLQGVAVVLLVLYVIVHFRTRSLIQAATKQPKTDE